MTTSRLALAGGVVAEPAGWVEALGLSVEAEPSYPREREYLLLARVLLATLDTVKSHVSRLLDKLGTTNRTQAIGRARELGLVR